MFAYDDEASRDKIKQWNKVAKEYSNLKDIQFAHCDLTSAFFEGMWPYWTPLIRFYKQSNLKWFDYYYDEVSKTKVGEYIELNSEAYKWHNQKIEYTYKVQPEQDYFVYQNYCSDYTHLPSEVVKYFQNDLYDLDEIVEKEARLLKG